MTTTPRPEGQDAELIEIATRALCDSNSRPHTRDMVKVGSDLIDRGIVDGAKAVIEAVRGPIAREAKRAALIGFREAIDVSDFSINSESNDGREYVVYAETLRRYIKTELAALEAADAES